MKNISIYPQYKLILILVLCTLIVPIYFIYFSKHHESIRLDTLLQLDPPKNSLNLTFHHTRYYLDLDQYPIENYMMRMFPATERTIKRMLLGESIESHANSTDCANHLLPYPILRHIVQDYLPLQQRHPLFDIPVEMSGPFMLLPPGEFHAGQTVCVRLVVPYENKSRDDPYRLLYRPYPQHHARLASPWWDTFVVSLNHVDSNASMPIRLQPWVGHGVLRHAVRKLKQSNPSLPEWVALRDEVLFERERVHVYETDVVLPEGRWELEGVLDFVEGRYNFEYGPVTQYEPIRLATQHLTMSSLRLSDTAFLKQHLQLPLCTGMDHPGRWMPYPNDVPVSLPLTRSGKYWAPFQCRYRAISYEQFNRCASQKYPAGINVFGDSNSRRSLKKFLSHGKWCQGWETHRKEHPMFWKEDSVTKSMFTDATAYQSPQEYTYTHINQTRSCFCEDYTEYKWNTSWFDARARTFTLALENTAQQAIDVGKTEWDGPERHDNVTVNSYKWDGLTFLNNPGWTTAVISMPVDIDVAIFSLGNWDASFSTLDAFLNDVDALIRQIRDHYDLQKTKIIYRTPQYYCCRVDTSSRARQVSGPRLDAFDKEARKRFSSELNATIWDTYVLGESKTWHEKNENVQCSSNHVPADEVEIENQILMNGLCNS